MTKLEEDFTWVCTKGVHIQVHLILKLLQHVTYNCFDIFEVDTLNVLSYHELM
jgi:hypothetical protein